MKQLNTRFLTILTTLAFLGFTVSTLAGKAVCGDGVCKGNEPTSCPSDCDDVVNSISYFTIGLEGTSITGEGDDWINDSGQSQVSYKSFYDDRYGSYGRLTDLSYFINYPAWDGDACFPDEIIPMHAALIKKAKKGSAKALIWFWGYTELGEPGGLVPYQLGLTGSFTNDIDFPPPPGEPSTMEMIHWKMDLANQGQGVKAISCIGERPNDENFSVNITVTGK